MVDLFGLPLRPKRGRGRPAHVWTPENSNKVNLLFACGRKVEEVAEVLGITKPTFYKHYFNEVSRAGLAPLMLKARQLERLNTQAEAGNVAAEKALAAMVHAERLTTLQDRMSDAQDNSADRATRAVASPKMGKKDMAQLAAQSAGVGTEWGADLLPETIQ